MSEHPTVHGVRPSAEDQRGRERESEDEEDVEGLGEVLAADEDGSAAAASSSSGARAGRAAAQEEREEMPEGAEDMVCDESGSQHARVEEQEGRVVRPVPAPSEPSRAEREAHEVSHWPYRSWCPYCVMGRGRDKAHRRRDGSEPRRPQVVADYCFMSRGDRAEAERAGARPVLVVKEVSDGPVLALAVPRKGGDAAWVARRCARWLDNLGHKRITIKTDQEPSIEAWAQSVRKAAGEGTEIALETSPVGESQANGAAEQAVQEVKGLIRTLKAMLDDRAGVEVTVAHPVYPFLVEHAGTLLSKYKVYSDGKTAYERVTGRKSCPPMCAFGEKILFLPLKGARQRKWQYGVFLGVMDRSGEFVIANAEGHVIKARTIKRLVVSSRWDKELLNNIKGSPWAPVDGEKVEGIPVEVHIPPVVDVPVIPEAQNTQVRRMKIGKNVYLEHGHPECRGCEALRRGRDPRPHSKECIERVTKAIGDLPEWQEKLKRDKERVNWRLAERIEQQDKRARTEGSAAVGTPGGPFPSTRVSEGTGAAATEPGPAPAEVGGAVVGGASGSRSRGREDEVAAEEQPAKRGKADEVAPASVKRAGDGEDPEEGKRMRIQVVAEEIHKDGVEESGMRMAIAEAYSPPRVTRAAERHGLRAGWSLDLTTRRKDGRAWDFSQAWMREEARALAARTKPRLIVGSPPCTPFSALQNLSKRGREEQLARERAAAEVHLRFCCQMYKDQAERGDLFLHEHPLTAESWKLRVVQEMMALPGAVTVVADQCRFGLTAVDKDGPGLVKKPTRFVTNSAAVARRLDKRCAGGHRHVHLVSGRAAGARVYPRGLCDAVCQGLVDDYREHAEGRAAADADASVCLIEMNTDKLREGDLGAREVCSLVHGGSAVWDDVRGGYLDPELVRQAREEEMRYVREAPVYRKVDRREAVAARAPIIKVRWVDTNKGTEEAPEVRSRLVAMELKSRTGDMNPFDVFSATPPIEAVRLVVSHAASYGRYGRGGERGFMVIDVRRAYFNARARRKVFTEIPGEDWESGDEDRCAELVHSLYGTRDAGRNWYEELREFLEGLGGTTGKASVSVYRFVRDGRVVKVAVHGDDTVCAGDKRDCEWLKKEFEKRFEIKHQSLGTGPGEKREVKVLNRLVRLVPEGIEMEADPRHARALIEEMGVEAGKSVGTPMAADSSESRKAQQKDDEEAMEPGEATRYRALAARLNYLAMDRPDLQVATLAASRRMSSPVKGDWAILKRVARYLRRQPRAACLYRWQRDGFPLVVCTDSDWAGCKATRVSTSGGVVYRGEHVVKTWCRTQHAISLSSMEAELYAAVLGVTQGEGVRALLQDFGEHVKLTLAVDSSAAMGIIAKEGLGKAKHIQTQWLWVQQARRQKRLELAKVKGTENPADLMTKMLSEAVMRKHMSKMNYQTITE